MASTEAFFSQLYLLKQETLQTLQNEKSPGLWTTDNGMTLCSDHLGQTARCTGADLSGMPIIPSNDDYSCETCVRVKPKVDKRTVYKRKLFPDEQAWNDYRLDATASFGGH